MIKYKDNSATLHKKIKHVFEIQLSGNIYPGRIGIFYICDQCKSYKWLFIFSSYIWQEGKKEAYILILITLQDY